jgi:hypothetical protein
MKESDVGLVLFMAQKDGTAEARLG